MATVLTSLLCLGLSLGQKIHAQAGTLPKPTIWAEPGSMSPQGRPVIIWCQGSLEAEAYFLYREGARGPWGRQLPLGPRSKVKFFIPRMTVDYAGRAHCYYLSNSGASGHSDPLDLVMIGVYGQPTLSALPSPVVTSGGTVTLQCGSWVGYDRFVLSQEGEHEQSWLLDPQRRSDGLFQAEFRFDTVVPNQRWTFRCHGLYRNYSHVWSTPSDSLDLLVSGLYRKPELLQSLPNHLLVSGEHRTLRCLSDVRYERFALFKEGGLDFQQQLAVPHGWQPLIGISQAHFHLGNVTHSHGGKYRCYGGYTHSHEWSAPSEPLEVLVTGELPYAPSLSVWPGPAVVSGGKVTLQCASSNQADAFLLFKEGGEKRLLHLMARPQGKQKQANFTMNPVTSAHAGTYRCYGSLSTSPYILSWPSGPLELRVSGPPVQNGPSLKMPEPKSGPPLPDYILVTLIHTSLSGLLLLVTGALVCLAWHSQRRNQGAK
ncbi:leukocyte immunoglobulin-like receptor subfamily A member 6 [Echinops telfairi]|uniref:Leukocyte immunoglobulin-like receptor subfamily A member 6 n=1 Tax=Echinops telfairi TaxID=9371 RepID=A0AC55D9B4_ECHTE|nr:leukocyte immunoglobulin-like receptor subfamily A member 6 [Echinops telfairi]